MDAFDYTVKKDVRNSAIVRELDEARQRELWRSVAVGGFLVGVLLFYAWQHFELLRHGYEIEQMQQERVAEEEVNRHLRLEVETLRAPQRIEQLATERLKMVGPRLDDTVIIERVTPAEAPAPSVVASR